MAIIGFPHTADVHVGTFGGLLADLAPDVPGPHVVDAALLEDARAGVEASMAPAAGLLTGLAVPVLSSPRAAAVAAVATIRGDRIRGAYTVGV
ncbi:hypothetical protein [Dactylosporangium sp. NPDC005555]|uniref:hypothetical protein n=1 Tax=Dactylosporangium sp. NPDC005555 TaxID=3154889 RepID=UPI0033ABFBDB